MSKELKQSVSTSTPGSIPEGSPAHKEQLLVCAAQSGSTAAFAELQHRYSRRVYRTILGITRNEEDAEDALQESFFRAYLGLKGFQGNANFYTWLTRIAINASLMILRRRRTHLEISMHCSSEVEGDRLLFDLSDTQQNPEESYERRQQHLKLLNAIRRLTPPLRKVVEIRMIRDCSLLEIASELKISEAAVKSRLSRARKRLASSQFLARWHKIDSDRSKL